MPTYANRYNGTLGVIDVELTFSSKPDDFELGELCTDEQGNEYRFVQLVGGVDGANGSVLTWRTHSPSTANRPWSTTADRSDDEDNVFAGVCVGDVPNDDYCWVMVRGYHPAVRKNVGALTAGDVLRVADGSTEDHECESQGSGNISGTTFQRLIGVAVSDAGSSAETVRVRIGWP